jgi:hypothetical protein
MSYSPYPWLIKLIEADATSIPCDEFSIGIVAQINEPQLLPPEKPAIVATTVEYVCAVFKGEHDVDNATLIVLAPRMASLIEALHFSNFVFAEIFTADDERRIRDEVNAIYSELKR